MKKFYALVLLLSGYTCAAQVSVTASEGTAGPTTYVTLKTAFDAINAATHRGNIAITVTGSTTETSPAVLNASGELLSNYTAISIKPAAGVASSITGTIAGPLIDLNGADNLTIDGLNSGGSTLTIVNNSTSNAAEVSTVRFMNDASNNFIQNASVLGAGSSTVSGTLFFSAGGTLLPVGNDNNFIANCTIADAGGNTPTNAIYSAGTAIASQENSANTIFNNNIANFFNAAVSTAGVLLASGNTEWTISGNKFYQTQARTFTTGNPHRIIQIIGGNRHAITNNALGFASAGGTGIYTIGGAVITRFLAIDLAVGTIETTSVQNNTVAGFSFTTSNNASSASGIWSAINVTAGNVAIGTEIGNNIGSLTNTGNILINPTVAGTLTVGITSSSIGTVTIANNNIGGIDVLPTALLSGNLLGIQAQGASGTVNITNNTIGGNVAQSMRVGVAGTTTGNGIIRGILNSNSGTVNITNNTIRNLTHNSSNALALFRGIECQQGQVAIRNNILQNISANGASIQILVQEGVGILLSSGAEGNIIEGNQISNLSVTNATTTSGTVLSGIYLASAVNGVSILRNTMFGFSNAGIATSTTAPPVICGIYCRDAVATSPLTIANNMLSFGNGQTTNTSIIGIWNQVASAALYPLGIYHNTINIEGTATSGTQPTFGYYRGDFTTTTFASPAVDIKNNIFTNTRSGGTGKHYALANGYPSTTSSAGGWAANAADYNILNASAQTIGYWSGDRDFAGWQTASGGDAHSLSGVNVNYVNSANDLHLANLANAAIDNKGTAVAGVLNDIDNEIRSTSTPDIGADEFPSAPLAVGVEYFKGKKLNNEHQLAWKASCNSSSVKFDIERSSDGRRFESIGSIVATQARCAAPFNFTDTKPLSNVNYYRLKMTEIDGNVTYSSVVTIAHKNNLFEITGLYPNVVKGNESVLNIYATTKTQISIVVTDQGGKRYSKQLVTLSEGKNQFPLRSDQLSPGVYYLAVYGASKMMEVVPFLKQ